MRVSSARLMILCLVSSAAASAAPVLRSRNPVVNAASYRTPGLPGSAIARGSIFTIFGTGLGPSQYAQAKAFPLPTKLAETSVAVMVGSTPIPAIVLFAYSTQVNAILPSGTPVGTGTITVTYNGETSAPVTIEVVESAFGIFAYNSSGSGQAIATDTNYHLNSIIRTFHPGDYGILWGTGLGAINGSDAEAPPVGNLPASVKVYVGNSTAAVSYQGRSGCCSGLDQIVFQIPNGVQGCHVPIAVETAGVVSNITTIAVSATGQTCTDSMMGQELVDKLASGQNVRFGYVRMESLIAPFMPGQAFRASVDLGYGTFSEYTPETAGLAQYGVSSGYCVAVDCSLPFGCSTRGANGSLADSSPAQLHAGGALVLQGQSSASLQGYGGYYIAQLNATGSRFLWADLSYSISSPGGTRVGSFSVTNRASVPGVQLSGLKVSQTVPLSGDLTVEWTDADRKLQNGHVTIGAYSGNNDLSQWVWLQCTAPAEPAKFTIPGWILSTLPPSGTGHNGTIAYPQGWIWIGQYNAPVVFNPEGLDRGLFTDAFFNGYGIYFQ